LRRLLELKRTIQCNKQGHALSNKMKGILFLFFFPSSPFSFEGAEGALVKAYFNHNIPV